MKKKRKKSRRRHKKSPFKAIIIIVIVLAIFAAIALGALWIYNKLNENFVEFVQENQDDMTERNHPLEYTEFIYKYADEYGVPRSVVLAVIKTESKFDPNAISHAKARGLMQLTEATYNDVKRWLGESELETDVYDPETNIKYGTYYLSRLYNNYFSDWELVYAAYNAGPNRVLGWLEDESVSENGKLINIPYSETASYVEKVKAAREKYLELYDLGETYNEGT